MAARRRGTAVAGEGPPAADAETDMYFVSQLLNGVKVACYVGPPRGDGGRSVRCPGHFEHGPGKCKQSWTLTAAGLLKTLESINRHITRCKEDRGASAGGHAPVQGQATGPTDSTPELAAIPIDATEGALDTADCGIGGQIAGPVAAGDRAPAATIKKESEATEAECTPAELQAPAPQAWPAAPLDQAQRGAQLHAERVKHERVVEAELAKQEARAALIKEAKKAKKAEAAPDDVAPAAEKAAGAQVAGASASLRPRTSRLWKLRETVMRMEHQFPEQTLANWKVEVAPFDGATSTATWPVRTCIEDECARRGWTIPWPIPVGRGANKKRTTGMLSSRDGEHIAWLVNYRHILTRGPDGITMSMLEVNVFEQILWAVNAMEGEKGLKTGKRKRTGDNAEGGEAQGSGSG